MLRSPSSTLIEASKADWTRASSTLIGDQSAPVAADVADGPAGPAKSPLAAGEAEDQDEGAAPLTARARTRRRGEDQGEDEDQGESECEDEDEQAKAEDASEGLEGSLKLKPKTRAQRRRQQQRQHRKEQELLRRSLVPEASSVPRPNRLIRQGRAQGPPADGSGE